MSNLLYIAFKDKSAKHHGIEKKVMSQCNMFEKEGFDTTLIQRNNADIILEKVNKPAVVLSTRTRQVKNKKLQTVLDRYAQIKCIKEHISNEQYDYCYIRYDLSDMSFLSLIQLLHKQGSKIVLEIPTFPYKNEYSSSILHKGKYYIDKLYASRLKKYVHKIVTFYDKGMNIHGIDTITIPNGFDFSRTKIINTDLIRDDSEIHIIGVSSMREWHGYERFILGLRDYYKDATERNVLFHVVGDGKESKKYKRLVSENNLDKYVVFHGNLNGTELDNIYDLCDVGVDSLARHRTNISVLSSLKSREYGAKGLPIINSCEIDILKSDFKYLLKVSPDETPINIKEVIEFYDEIYSGIENRSKIANEIRNYIQSKSDMSIVFKPVIQFFKNC